MLAFQNLNKQLAAQVTTSMSNAMETMIRFLSRMYELTQKIKDIDTNSGVAPKILNDYKEEIRSMIDKQPGSLGLKLYLERLHSLCNLKLTEVAMI